MTKPETPLQALWRIIAEEFGDDALRRVQERYNQNRRAYNRQRSVERARASLAHWRAAAEDAMARNLPGRMWTVRRYERLKKLIEEAEREAKMDHDDLPDDAPGGDDPDAGPYADERGVR